MKLPSAFIVNISRNIQKVSDSLFEDAAEKDAFINAITSGSASPYSALLWRKSKPSDLPFKEEELFSWAPDYLSFVQKETRPGKLSLHDEGYFYAMDVTSALCGSVFTILKGERVLDVCSAPGGKASFAWRAIKPKELITNEVIQKRIGALISNIKRCSLEGTSVTSIDPNPLGEIFEGSCDLVIVDAPCSGQSLVVKGEKYQSPFHPTVINKCAMRQRRILSSSAKAVTSGGYLAYMTCTFSKEENEGIVSWFLDKNRSFKGVSIPHLEEFRSRWSDSPSYRFFPHRVSGAGGFVALFKKEGLEERLEPKEFKPRFVL